MTDAGFFKGTSTEQDARFADKKKKLMKTMKFSDNLSAKVDMTKINLSSIRPWIIKRVTELLNFEDEVVCDYVFNQLEVRYPDPKDIQINITGFLNSKNARIFLSELWDLLISAMQTPNGVPSAFLEAKKEEILQGEDPFIKNEISRREQVIKHKVSTVAKNLAESFQSTDDQDTLPDSLQTKKASSRRRSMSRSLSPQRKVLRSDKKNSFHKRRHSVSSSSGSDSNMSESSQSCSPKRPYDKKESGSRYDQSRSKRNNSPLYDNRSTKRSVAESDWRKDLMAGRRRSPPRMPERNHGSDKHAANKSKKHHHSHRDVYDDHGSKPHRHYRDELDARSQRSRQDNNELSESGRRDHHRRTDRYADNVSGRYSSHRSRSGSFHNERYKIEKDRQKLDDVRLSEASMRRSNRSQDSTHLGSANVSRKRYKSPKKARSSSSSSSGSASSSNSSASDSSSSGSNSEGTKDSSSSSSDSEGANSPTHANRVAEGPELPSFLLQNENQLAEDELLECKNPEGPQLPPDFQISEGNLKSSYTSSDTSGSSSSDDGSSDSERENVDENVSTGKQAKHIQSKHCSDQNGVSPEGPILLGHELNINYKNSKIEESSEDALRKRALDSMSRTNKHV